MRRDGSMMIVHATLEVERGDVLGQMSKIDRVSVCRPGLNGVAPLSPVGPVRMWNVKQSCKEHINAPIETLLYPRHSPQITCQVKSLFSHIILFGYKITSQCPSHVTLEGGHRQKLNHTILFLVGRYQYILFAVTINDASIPSLKKYFQKNSCMVKLSKTW